MSTRIPELTSFLRELQLEQYAEDANKWCEDMGAAFFQEIWEERQELAEALNLKPLEKKRLLGERGIEAFRSRLPPNVFTFTSMSAPGAPPSPSHAMSEQRAPRVIMEPVTSSSSSKPSTTRFVPRILQSVGPRCHSCQNPIASGDKCSACLAAAHQRRSSFSDGNRCRWCQIPIAGGEFCYPCSGVIYQQHQNQPEDHQIWLHSNVDYCDTGVQPPASATTESMTTAAHVYTHSDDNPGDMGSAASYATASSSENGICTPPDVDALLSDCARRRAHENVQISRGDAGTGASGDVFLQDDERKHGDDTSRELGSSLPTQCSELDSVAANKIRDMVYFLQPELGTLVLQRLRMRDELLTFAILKREVSAILTQLEGIHFQ